MSISEKLTTIAENQEKVYNKGGLDYSPQETVSGEAIGITDISPIEHNMGVSVKKMNLLKYPYVGTLSGNSKGITITDNGDGTLTINGNDTDTTKYASIFFMDKELHDYLIDGLTYYFGIEKPDKFLAGNIYILVNNNETSANEWLRGSKLTVNKAKYTYNRIYVQINGSDSVFENVIFKPYLSLYDTKKYTPYIEDISTVKLYKGGKNLVNEKAVAPIAVNAEGVTRYGWDLGVLPQGNYTLTAYGNYVKSKTVSYKIITDGVYGEYISLDENTKTKTITLNGSQGLIVYLYQGVTDLYDNVTLQLEFGTTPTEYEPYIEPTVYDVPTDGIVEGVASLYPSTTLYTDTSGAVIDCTYYQDGKKVKENLTDMILELGGVINE